MSFNQFNANPDEKHLRPEAGITLDKMLLAVFERSVLPRLNEQEKVALIVNTGEFAKAIDELTSKYPLHPEHPVAIARAYIDANYAQNVNLPTLAKILGITTSHISRQFHKLIGMSMVDYLNRVRIAAVMELIRQDPDIMSSQVAEKCGFFSLTHFNRVFKNIAKMTPSDYRKQLTDKNK